MSVVRDKLWYLLNDKSGELAALELELDVLDAEIDAERRVVYERTKAGLERLGFDTSNYRPPPYIARGEQRCLGHLTEDDDIEALVVAAQETALERAYREHLEHRAPKGERTVRRALGQVLGVG
jgi:hypothetical protein